MGSPDFAIPSFKKIYESHHKIVAIVTQPDRPKGRGLKLQPPAVKRTAESLFITPIIQPIKLNDPQFLTQLKNLKADLYVVVAFRILPEEIFMIPPKGTINLHPSLLPKYRGAAPIHWALISGEKETGVTIIKITREIDAGGILLQRKLMIHDNETAGSLHDRLSVFGAQVLLEAIDLIENEQIQVKAQDDTLATSAPKLNKEICHISFNQPAEKVKNWINGLSPVPAAFAYLDQKVIRFYRAIVIDSKKYNIAPGTVIQIENGEIHISCQPGKIAVIEMQKEGKKRMSSEEFLRGSPLKVGEIFI
jgi:methionyl-tRNA formyltransferase